MKWIISTIIISAAILALSAGFNAINSNKGASEGREPALSAENTFRALLQEATKNKNEEPLKGEENNQINFLLLGVGGEEHISGNYLTDTIIVAILAPATNGAALISIPRDLMVRSPDRTYFTKINALYSLPPKKNNEIASLAPDPHGEIYKKFPGPMGVEHTKSAIKEITGLDINYYAVMDLAGVEKVVDILGGINIRRTENLSDEGFPDENYGYQTYKIDEGWRYLTGEEAAKYIRTRHTSGGDFDRMKRQQEVAVAIKNKVAGLKSVSGLPKLLSIYKALQDHFVTDLTFSEIMRLMDVGEGVSAENAIFERITSDLPAGSNPNALLVSDIEIWGGQEAYVLKPKAGVENYDEIKNKIQRIINNLK